ncbi:MAG: hydrogenase [Gammaproteobacteria bacterium]
MTSPAITKLLTQYRYPLLDADSFDLFIYGTEYSVLFFCNDPAQFPESNDVAVILPELLKAFAGRLQAAVVDRSIERELQVRFRFTAWPALVFLKRGDYLGAITGIRDWNEYLQQSAQFLSTEPTQPPPFDFDKACHAVAH